MEATVSVTNALFEDDVFAVLTLFVENKSYFCRIANGGENLNNYL